MSEKSDSTKKKVTPRHKAVIAVAILVALILLAAIGLFPQRQYKAALYGLYCTVIPIWFYFEHYVWPDTDKEWQKWAREIWTGAGMFLAGWFGLEH